jgi:ornithine decarboxylase
LGETSSFYLVETKSVKKRIAMWRQMLPSADIFYSVKSCPDPQVLRSMMQEGTNFDCASMQEIEHMLGLGC